MVRRFVPCTLHTPSFGASAILAGGNWGAQIWRLIASIDATTVCTKMATILAVLLTIAPVHNGPARRSAASQAAGDSGL